MRLRLDQPCVFCGDACERMDTYEPAPADAPNYLVARVDGFRILSDNAPLSAGHLLLVPDGHVASFAVLDAATLSRGRRLVAHLSDTLHEITGTTTLAFEHGHGPTTAAAADAGGHAVMHLLAADVDVSDWFRRRRVPRLAEVTGIADLAQLGTADYLYVQRAGESGHAWDATGLPPQLLRRLVGDRLDADLWNWHDWLMLLSRRERTEAIERNLHLLRAAVRGVLPLPRQREATAPTPRTSAPLSHNTARSQSAPSSQRTSASTASS